jgi:hypothetical protein
MKELGLVIVTVYVAVPPEGREVGETLFARVSTFVGEGDVRVQGVEEQVPKLPEYFCCVPLTMSANGLIVVPVGHPVLTALK